MSSRTLLIAIVLLLLVVGRGGAEAGVLPPAPLSGDAPGGPIPQVIATLLTIDQDAGFDDPGSDPTDPSGDESATPAGRPEQPDVGDHDQFPSPVVLSLFIVLALVALALGLKRGWRRLPASPRYPVAFSPLLGLGLFLAMFILGSVGVRLAAAILATTTGSGAEAPLSADEQLWSQAILRLGSLVAFVPVLVLLVVLVHRASSTPSVQRLGHARTILAGLGAFLLFWPLVNICQIAATWLNTALRGEPTDPLAHETLILLQDSTSVTSRVVTVALVVLIAPIIEEVMYRGLLQSALRHAAVPGWVAITVTSVFFAAMHASVVPLHALPALFVLSLGMGWIYERTGRLLAPILMHAAFNFGNIALLFLLPTPA